VPSTTQGSFFSASHWSTSRSLMTRFLTRSATGSAFASPNEKLH